MSEPEIVDTETEAQILYRRICAKVSRVARHQLNPHLIVRDDMEDITAVVVTGILRELRVLSGRQLAVMLAQEANRHEVYVIDEPPRYSADEIAET